MSIASVCLRWRAVALSPTMRHLWTYISLSVPRLPIGSSNLRHTIIRSDIICIVDDFDEFYLARSGHERLIVDLTPGNDDDSGNILPIHEAGLPLIFLNGSRIVQLTFLAEYRKINFGRYFQTPMDQLEYL